MGHCILLLIAFALSRTILFFSNEYSQEAFEKNTCKQEMIKHNKASKKIIKALDYTIYFLCFLIFISLF